MKQRFLVLIPAALFIAATAIGQTATPVVTERQINQHERIKEGQQSGELTKPEARRLKMREAKIRHDKRAAKADGIVTPEERAKLNREQNRTSRAIHRQKHDEQTAPEKK
jgi:uncharacterized membrane protein YebE (DUF533 family)